MQQGGTLTTGKTMHPSSFWWLAAFVGLCLAVGMTGSLFTRDAVATWYPTLDRPSWTPPDWVFAPVWTTLYVLIGIAGWRVQRLPFDSGRNAMHVWWIQLILNAIWTPLFFGAHALGAAFIVIALLWLSILRFARLTWRVDRAASLLFLPYLAWVSYAASLNLAIWQSN